MFHFGNSAWSSDGVLQNSLVVLFSLLDAFFGFEQSKQAILLVFFPGSNVHITVGQGQDSLSVFLPIFQVAFVDRTVFLNDFSRFENTLFEFAFVEVSGGSLEESAFAGPLAVDELALVPITSFFASQELFNSVASSFFLKEVSFVLSVSEIPLESALAVLLSFDPLSVVKSAVVWISKTALAMVKSVLPKAVVDSFVVVVHSALAFELGVFGESSVVVSVSILDLSEALEVLDIFDQPAKTRLANQRATYL